MWFFIFLVSVQELDKQKCIVSQYETQLATKQQGYQNEKALHTWIWCSFHQLILHYMFFFNSNISRAFRCSHWCVWIWMQEATQKVFEGKINSIKIELTTLQNQLESNNLEQQKIKKVCQIKWRLVLSQF